MPTRWYNIIADLPAPPPPPLHPGHAAAGRAGRPRPAVPDGADRAGGRPASGTSTSRARCSTSTGCGGRRRCSGRTGWRGARHPGPDLLQVRGRLARPARTSRTPPCRRPTTTPGGHPAADHRDRRRAVGHRARVRLRAVRAGVRDLAGRRVVRPEAVPADHDGDLRREVHPPVATLTRPAGAILAEHPDSPARSASPSARRSRWPPGRGHQLRPGQRAQPRAAAPDRHR